MNSYTKSRLSPSEQKPISLTKFEWRSCPRKLTSVCTTSHTTIINRYKLKCIVANKTRTNHSLCPWNPSGFNFLTAMTTPDPGLAAVRVWSSIHPLKTYPNPPSPRRLSGLKFLVEFFNSLNEKGLAWGDDRISASVFGVGRLSPLLLTVYEGMLILEGGAGLPVFPGNFEASEDREQAHNHYPINS